MSSLWPVRLAIHTLGCVAVLAFCFVGSVNAQGGPPDVGDVGGDRTGDRFQRPKGNERPGSIGNRSSRGGQASRGNQDQRTQTKAPRPKFVNLLESKDLSQFRGYKNEEIGEGWSIDGKYLYFDGSGGGDLITKEVYDDFDLQVEWKVADGANSGIMWRVSLGDDATYMSGPEYQILDDAEHSDGKNPVTSAGSLYGLYAPKGEKKLRDVGTWNKTRIIVEGNKVTHYLNAVKIVEAEIGSEEWNKLVGESKFKDWEKYGKNSEGHIAFQDHGNEVWFRNVRIKRLSTNLSDQHAAASSKTPRRSGSKFDQMQNSVPGADAQSPKGGRNESRNSDRGAKTQPSRGSKFEKMQNSVPGSQKPGGPIK